MLLNILIGCSVFLLTNISLLYTSHLLVRRFISYAPASVRLVATGTLFYTFIILIFQALSPFHAISRTWVTVTCLLLALVSHYLWGKQRNLKADIEPIQVWIRDCLTSRWAVLLVICGFVVLFSLSRALLMPPLAWDCLTYHLTFAALWIKKGTLFLFKAPDQIFTCAYLPINGEIFSSWFLLPFHNDLLANTMNFPITFLGGISCYAIARELGLTRKEAGFAPALICFAPVIYSQITNQYVDITVFAFCSAAVLFTLRYLRGGYLQDSFFALIASGILLGTKFTGIPVVGLIFVANTMKTVRLVTYRGFLKKVMVFLIGLGILCVLGGRQYIVNTIEAGNPLYPFPIKIAQYQIFDGSDKLEQVREAVCEQERTSGWEKFNWWEREYRKFCYLSRTAGPKFFLFLILALISLFNKPHDVSRRCWYFLSVMWIVPILIYYTNTSASFTRKAWWIDGSSRFFSPYIALFTIQSLFIIKKINKKFKGIDLFLLTLVVWDLQYVVNTPHLWEVEILYPLVVVILFLLILFFKLLFKLPKQLALKKESSSNIFGLVKFSDTITKQEVVFAFCLVFLFTTALYSLQSYRDSSRYSYFFGYTDLINFSRDLVSGWEYLDNPDKKVTIAMTMDWKAPGHNWFFYPLLGRYLQNDIVYISAKYKKETPAKIHRGLLRGDNLSTWFYNLKREDVDYILVRTPWPIELEWMLQNTEKFQLVFSEEYFRIFKYVKEKM